MTSIPDDLSGMDQTPPMRSVGDIDPATLAVYDQILQYLRQVSHRLFYLTMVAQTLDPQDPQQAAMMQSYAAEASEIVWALDEQNKALLINMLVGQLVSAADHAAQNGWLPTNQQLDDPIRQEEIAILLGVPVEELQETVVRLKARRARAEGDARPDAPGHQPPA